MFLKVISSKRKRHLQLLDYLTNNEDRLVNNQGESFELKQMLFGKDNEEMAKEFEERLKIRKYPRKGQVEMVHTVMSFSPKDAPTMDALKDLTTYYLEHAGIDQSCSFAHFEKGHVHVHTISNAVNIIGLSTRISQEQMAALKIELQQRQLELHDLHHSVVDHGKKKREQKIQRAKDREYFLKKSQQSTKEQLLLTVQSCLARSYNREDFKALLAEQNCDLYSRGKVAAHGIEFNNRKYRLRNLLPDFDKDLADLNQREQRMNTIVELREQELEQIQTPERMATLNQQASKEQDGLQKPRERLEPPVDKQETEKQEKHVVKNETDSPISGEDIVLPLAQVIGIAALPVSKLYELLEEYDKNRNRSQKERQTTSFALELIYAEIIRRIREEHERRMAQEERERFLKNK